MRIGALKSDSIALAALLTFKCNACNEYVEDFLTMAMLTMRNLPDEAHRALRARAALRGRSTEAEVRAILEESILP